MIGRRAFVAGMAAVMAVSLTIPPSLLRADQVIE